MEHKVGILWEVAMRVSGSDIRANITLTRVSPVYSGYRPAHLIANYLTTGVHEYFYYCSSARYLPGGDR